MNKPPCDNLLAQLTQEQQSQVYDWLRTLGYTDTIKKLAEPVPHGFGLKTRRSGLHRFYRRCSQSFSRRDVADALDLQAGSTSSSIPLLQGSEDAVRHLATSPEGPASFKDVSRWSTKQQYLQIAQEHLALARQRVDLEKQRLDLDHKKFLFNAARAAREHHAELGEILKKDDLDGEEKISAARSVLFQINELPKRKLSNH